MFDHLLNFDLDKNDELESDVIIKHTAPNYIVQEIATRGTFSNSFNLFLDNNAQLKFEKFGDFRA